MDGGTVRGSANGKVVEARGQVNEYGSFRLTSFQDGDGVVAGEHQVAVVALPPRDSRTPPPAVLDGQYGDIEKSGLTVSITPETKEVVFKMAKPTKRSEAKVEK